MAHVYATLADLKNYITDGGSSSLGTTNDTLLLAVLESVSAVIDDRCERSAFGSGFGPRTGTNKYDGRSTNKLRLRDDLLTVTSVLLRDYTASSGTQAPVADTDYYLLNAEATYSPGPYRTMLLHLQGIPIFGYGFRVTEIAGTWGYQNVTVTLTATTSAISTTTTTSVTVSAGTEFSAGQTLLSGTEQMYVSAVSGTTLTVVRGANGSTAATHGAAAAVAKYVYPGPVREVCLRLALRRWKARDAGADGMDSGVFLPGQVARESEERLLSRGLFGLRLKEMQ